MTSNSKSKLSHLKYRPDIDGLRAIAVLSVVAFHAFPSKISGGFIGVDVFFVISGFLISTIILKSLKDGSFSFYDFYTRRIKRIFPALLIVLSSTLFFGWFVLYPDELNQLAKHIFVGTIFSSNFILWSEVDYFDSAAETKPLLHLWSLGIEEQFYIVWPLLLWFCWRKRFNIIGLILFCVVISFGLNIFGAEKDLVATFYSPQTRFWELLFGAFLAWFMLEGKKTNREQDSGGSLDSNEEIDNHNIDLYKNIISLIGLCLLFFGLFLITKKDIFPGYLALVPVVAASLIILAGPYAWINRNILSNGFLVWFGLISFPLYLWHWPIISLLNILKDGHPSIESRIIAVVISVLFAWLTVKFIEKPFRFSKSNESVKLYSLIVLMIFIFFIGLFLSKKDFSTSHVYENLLIKRKGFEHAIGSSLKWYQGKDNWLFLGNSYNQGVAKLKGAIKPSSENIKNTVDTYSEIVAAASKENIRTVLLIGPNKSSVYSEYLPDIVTPSSERYIKEYLINLRRIKDFEVFDPINLLVSSKNNGLLYWRTDTHWNQKGAYFAYAGLMGSLGLPVPEIEFVDSDKYIKGDLIGISKIENFPVNLGDDYELKFKETADFNESIISGKEGDPFGKITIIKNNRPLTDKVIWVVGDSFVRGIRTYLNVTFKEVHYMGHWEKVQSRLPEKLLKAEIKPDMLLIVRVERSFD